MSNRERKRKREFYYREALKVGYRSRASFKLIQLQEKYQIFKQGDTVLDIGAAPGGWSQITTKYIGARGKIFALDLEYIEPIESVITIQADITENSILTKLKAIIEEPLDVIMSDLSPKVSGNWGIDHARQIYLSECALRLSVSGLLKRGGKFICKLFHGDLFSAFMNNLKQLFTVVYLYKPQASRKKSAEIYVIAKGLKVGPLKNTPVKREGDTL